MSSIDYDLRKIKTFVFGVDRVLSYGVISPHPNGDPMRTVNIKDGYALQLTVKKGYGIVIITGGYTETVRIRFSRLKIQHIYIRSAVKAHDFKDFVEKTGLSPEHIMYAGDDVPDYEVITRTGLPVASADATPGIKEIVKYMSSRRGGEGVARDVIEQTMRAQGH